MIYKSKFHSVTFLVKIKMRNVFFHSEKQSHFAWVMIAYFFPYGWVLFIGWGWQFSKDFVVDELYLWQQLRKVNLGGIRKEILGLLKNRNQPL